MTPNKGAKCADTGGGSPHPAETEAEDEPDALSSALNGLSVFAASAETELVNERSQIERRARPCAMEARRPTVQMMAASSASSSSATAAGSRCAARTKGRVVDA